MLHVLFQVGDADYVVPASDVSSMETFQGATRVPGTVGHVLGIMQVRGRVVPVVDLRARFGLEPAPVTVDSRVVVVRHREREVALLVDRARQVVDIADDQFRPPPDVVAEQAAGFVNSVAQAANRLVMRVDFEKVIGREPLATEVSHAAEA